MQGLGHVQQIELLHGFNDMTAQLKNFLVHLLSFFWESLDSNGIGLGIVHISLNTNWSIYCDWSFANYEHTEYSWRNVFLIKQAPFGESGRTVTSADIHDFFAELNQKKRRHNWHLEGPVIVMYIMNRTFSLGPVLNLHFAQQSGVNFEDSNRVGDSQTHRWKASGLDSQVLLSLEAHDDIDVL